MLSSPLSFFYALLNFLIPPPCLPISFSFPKCHPQHSFSCFFYNMFAVLSHSSGNPFLPPTILVTSYLNASSQLVFFSIHHLIFGCTFSAFFFFILRAIWHITIWCCFATHLFTITLQSHIFFRSLLLHIT